MSSFIDPRQIFNMHFNTLKNANTRRIRLPEIFVFFIAPAIAGVSIYALFNIKLEDNVRLIITALALFIGFLLNANILIINFLRNSVSVPYGRETWRSTALTMTYSNISFEILLATITIFLLPLLKVKNAYFYDIISMIILTFLAMFMITFLMVLKRIHVLFQVEIDAMLEKPKKDIRRASAGDDPMLS